MTNSYFFPIDEVPAEKSAFLGGKSHNIMKLGQIPGINIPRTGAIVFDAFEHYVLESIPLEEMNRLMQDCLENNNRAPLFSHLAHLPFPGSLWDEIEKFVSEMPLVIVRSSGATEDSGSTSLAGHYESIISATHREELVFTIKSCWMVGLRVFLDYVLPHREYETYDDLSKAALNSIGLVVQEVINPEKSGIYFSESPLHPDREFVTANYGTCHSSVDGKMASDYFVLEKGEPDSQTIRFKFEMTTFPGDGKNYLPGEEVDTPIGRTAMHFPYGEYLYSARVPHPFDKVPVLNVEELGILNEASVKIREKLKYEIDMEWCFTGRKLYVLQVRPITTEPPEHLAPRLESGYVIASTGMAKGEVKIVHSPEDLYKVNEGDIIAVQATDPAFMPIIYRASGIISEDGSPLCHTAIVARELKIPCILGVEKATGGAFTEGEIIILDANRGVILREHEESETEMEDEPEINEIVYDMEHIKFQRKDKPPVVALSALLYGYFRETRWKDPYGEPVLEYLEMKRGKYDLMKPLVHWDIINHKNTKKEADLLLMELKSMLNEEGMLCRE